MILFAVIKSFTIFQKSYRPQDKENITENSFLISQHKTFAVGNQKIHLNETFEHPKHMFKLMDDKWMKK